MFPELGRPCGRLAGESDIGMYATGEGTARYAERFPEFRDAAFDRSIFGPPVLSLSIDTFTGALIAAGESGINFFDCAIDYRNRHSGRSIARALRQLQRDEIVVCTEAGFPAPGAVPDLPADQTERSRANLGVDTTWEGFRKKVAPSLPRLAGIAAEEGGPEHDFRFIQLPFDLGMAEAFVDRPESVLEAAGRLGIAVVGSATLLQTRTLANIPDTVRKMLPRLGRDAQRATQVDRKRHLRLYQ